MNHCCGEKRDTPFCPLCGKPLGSPSPLVSLLKYIRVNLAKAENALAAARSRFTSLTDPSLSSDAGRLAHEAKVENYEVVREARKKFDKWKSWADAVDVAMQDDRDARVIADWLLDNDEPVAAAKVRGAFFVGKATPPSK